MNTYHVFCYAVFSICIFVCMHVCVYFVLPFLFSAICSTVWQIISLSVILPDEMCVITSFMFAGNYMVLTKFKTYEQRLKQLQTHHTVRLYSLLLLTLDVTPGGDVYTSLHVGRFNKDTVSHLYSDSIINMWRFHDRLTFIMGIPIR